LISDFNLVSELEVEPARVEEPRPVLLVLVHAGVRRPAQKTTFVEESVRAEELVKSREFR
jgi:hypothetical protein